MCVCLGESGGSEKLPSLGFVSRPWVYCHLHPWTALLISTPPFLSPCPLAAPTQPLPSRSRPLTRSPWLLTAEKRRCHRLPSYSLPLPPHTLTDLLYLPTCQLSPPLHAPPTPGWTCQTWTWRHLQEPTTDSETQLVTRIRSRVSKAHKTSRG